jgi:acyl-CoA thioesterase-1
MPHRIPFRLALLAAALLSWTGGAQARQPDGTLVVTMLGDSLTAGYGLGARDAIPARLEAALKARGL